MTPGVQTEDGGILLCMTLGSLMLSLVAGRYQPSTSDIATTRELKDCREHQYQQLTKCTAVMSKLWTKVPAVNSRGNVDPKALTYTPCRSLLWLMPAEVVEPSFAISRNAADACTVSARDQTVAQLSSSLSSARLWGFSIVGHSSPSCFSVLVRFSFLFLHCLSSLSSFAPR